MPGRIGWIHLTVSDAETLRDFYQSVTGWTPAPVDMGGYSDFCMYPPGEAQPVAGICHARGLNSNLPPVGSFTSRSKIWTKACATANLWAARSLHPRATGARSAGTA